MQKYDYAHESTYSKEDLQLCWWFDTYSLYIILVYKNE